jgi:HAD superfamily hydrolase (TIGR01484 family)
MRSAFNTADFPVAFGEVAVVTTREHENGVRAILKSHGLDVNIEYNRSSLMVLPAGIDKGRGVLEALKLIGAPRKGVVCFGDAENDVPLFNIANVSVAVSNAVDLLKAKANFVTLKPGGLGVAEFIRTKILEK